VREDDGGERGGGGETVTPAAIVHGLAGTPAVDGCADSDGQCWICARPMARGMPVSKWQGATFTDQNKALAPDATHVCEPCVWAMSWVQPPGMPPAEAGKKGLNLRLFSHFFDARGYLALNKASKPAMLRWLREPKHGVWFAAIADTGQKHVLPWTPLNPAGGRSARFEERLIALPDDWSVVDAIAALLTLGVTKGEVERGEYSPRSYQEHGREPMHGFESAYRYLRGTGWFTLALWLAQRDEVAYEDRRRKGAGVARSNGRCRAGVAGAIPRGRREPAQALATDPRPSKDGRSNKPKRARVGNGDAAVAQDSNPEQLALFGNAGARR